MSTCMQRNDIMKHRKYVLESLGKTLLKFQKKWKCNCSPELIPQFPISSIFFHKQSLNNLSLSF